MDRTVSVSCPSLFFGDSSIAANEQVGRRIATLGSSEARRAERGAARNTSLGRPFRLQFAACFPSLRTTALSSKPSPSPFTPAGSWPDAI